MNLFRKTYTLINLDYLKYNINNIIKKYNNYTYYFGIVKANAYNHGDVEISKELIKNGINYLGVSSLDEALNIRKKIKEINILIMSPIDYNQIKIASKNNITITINSINYLKSIINTKHKIRVHIKLDTGMNRLGIKDNKELIDTINLIKSNKNIIIEGLYTHMANADSEDKTFYEKQIKKFNNITKNIDLNIFKIIHIGNSSTLLNHKKLKYINGIRIGLIMYGIKPFDTNIIDLKPILSLHSKVIQIKEINKDEYVGYNLNYKAKKKEIIAIVPIGYADGIIRKNTNRYVEINNNKYKIIGNICMDMLIIKIDNKVKIDDDVIIIGNTIDCNYIAKHLNTINYEVICSISDRVHKIYIKNKKIIKSKSNRFS